LIFSFLRTGKSGLLAQWPFHDDGFFHDHYFALLFLLFFYCFFFPFREFGHGIASDASLFSLSISPQDFSEEQLTLGFSIFGSLCFLAYIVFASFLHRFCIVSSSRYAV
jgi:hypothetical protein